MAREFTGHTMADIERMRRGGRDRRELPGMFRGTQFVSSAQLAEERALENAMEMQKLKNLGQVDVARTTGEFGVEGQRLRNIGQRDVTGIEQSGLAERARLADALGREKLAGEQYLELRELEQNPLTPAGYSYIPGFQEYRQTALGLGEAGEDQRSRRYSPITRADGTIEYYDQEGKVAYTERPTRTTPNVPGSALQNVGGQSPLTRPEAGVQQSTQAIQTSMQRPSLLRDIRGLGSRIGQSFRQSAAQTRQRPLSDFDQESQYRKLLSRNY